MRNISLLILVIVAEVIVLSLSSFSLMMPVLGENTQDATMQLITEQSKLSLSKTNPLNNHKYPSNIKVSFNKPGFVTYLNNFMGMEITIPSYMKTKIPVTSFARAAGDIMLFNSSSGERTVNISFDYDKFNKDDFIATVYHRCGEDIIIEQNTDFKFNIAALLDKLFIKNAYAFCLDNTTRKVNLETKRIGDYCYYYYALSFKNTMERRDYFIFPVGNNHITFMFFNQTEDIIAKIMKSIKFFKGANEDPNYPYW